LDPVSVAIGAAIGGATSKFVEKAWDSGEKWLQIFFKNHGQNSQIKAKENATEFLNELAIKIKQLEDSEQLLKEKIESAQDHPNFSFMLQKALISSAQTDSKEKHLLLARLVSERLKAEPESIISLSSKIACDAITGLTVNQIMILGLATNLLGIRPTQYPEELDNAERYQEFIDKWMIRRNQYYKNITISDIDILHLESLACLRYNQFVNQNIEELYKYKEYSYNINDMKETLIRDTIKTAWEKGLNKINLTSVGYIIGISISDYLTNTSTNIVGWD